jgi:hypothetical protein
VKLELDVQKIGPYGRLLAYVDVRVVTAWVFAGFDQAVDEPAVSNPSDVRLWLENMSLCQEQRLIGDYDDPFSATRQVSAAQLFSASSRAASASGGEAGS